MNRISGLCRAAGTAAFVLLAGCSGGGSVSIGNGQGADPGTVDFPIAYVKRTIPEDADDLRQQRDTAPDADLFFRDRASPSSVERNITERVTGSDRYDIKDVDVSANGRKIVFAMRGPLGANQDEEKQPSWQIWEYDIPTDILHRVIPSNTIASEGNDIGPQYLPDGRILFTSTRQRQSKAILLDESKAGFEAQTDNRSESAFVLHVMDGDGSNIHQITFNQSHDLWPSVLTDGRVLFTRWDGANGGRGMHLYTANPDGTDLQLLYGARSHQTGTPDANGPTTIQFTRPREMQNGRVLTLVRPFRDSDFGGDLVVIDTSTYVENTQPMAASAGLPGPAQTRATPNQVATVAGPSVGGRFRSAFPLWDGSNRILVSWSQCRLLDSTVTPATIVPCTPQRLADPNAQPAPSLYSAFVFDPADNTFKPLFQPVEGVMITDLVAAQPRIPPAVRLDHTLAGADFDPALIGEGVGLLEIRSVYDFDGAVLNAGPGTADIATIANPSLRTAARRPARFLRIEKAVSIGDKDLNFPDIKFNIAVGSGVGYMREILGYAPIEPDGSVSVRVPADVAFVISVLDQNGRRLFQAHRSWLQIRPGEIRRCNGCHQNATGGAMDRSHGRDGAHMPVPWSGAAASGVRFPATLAATAAGAEIGDTMAQARARTTCVSGSLCSQQPSVNLLYDDVWTDPTPAGANRPADDSLSYTYGTAGGFNTPPPVRTSCMGTWSSTCRTIVNYEQHIHPLWSLDRGANTCINCHTPADAMGAAREPAGHLDLSGTPSAEQQLHMTAYRELLFNDVEREVVGGALQVRLVPGPNDPDTGLPTMVPVPVQRSLVPTNALGSTRFFNKFAVAGSGVDHRPFLTSAELRLISEWVDIGAQYYNNPIGLRPDSSIRPLLHAALLTLATLFSGASAAADRQDKLQQLFVAEAYLELHEGPGRGYAVTQVVPRGDAIDVLYRRTEWFRVRTRRGIEGWAHQRDMLKTLLADGSAFSFDLGNRTGFTSHRWELGFMAGDYGGATLVSGFLSRSFNEQLAVEFTGSQFLGNASNGYTAELGLVHVYRPDWRLSPLLTLGSGMIWIQPKSTLVLPGDRNDQTAYAGAGLRFYVTRRFFVRAEYRHHMVFTTRNENEEINEWKLGLAFFF